ncbi:hypothetical protein GDO78_014331 [Eleutherodactylus coqui]|uniref:Uncharacterized protein n=1 Tax=Eleutherodactylus coqui TaxID=57060 RepID=A0A8J6EP30_ELECQ|nr:hypothetical protein GDO78_014331 [Eleutherodactylus coqui]
MCDKGEVSDVIHSPYTDSACEDHLGLLWAELTGSPDYAPARGAAQFWIGDSIHVTRHSQSRHTLAFKKKHPCYICTKGRFPPRSVPCVRFLISVQKNPQTLCRHDFLFFFPLLLSRKTYRTQGVLMRTDINP